MALRALQPNLVIMTGTLPAAGAEEIGTGVDLQPSARTVTVWVQYTRASVAGYPRFQFRWRANFSSNQYQGVSLNGSDLVTEEWPWVDGGASAVQRAVFKVEVPDGAQTFYLVTNEVGDTASPGSISARAGVGLDI